MARTSIAKAMRAELAFMAFLKEEAGHAHPRPIGRGLYASVCRFAFTHAIVVGRIGDCHSYEDRWCYRTYEGALAALEAWNGTGEPLGWHRHPLSGRRVAPTGEEYALR